MELAKPLPNIECLYRACHNLGLEFETQNASGNLVVVKVGGVRYVFANYATPFNDSSVVKVCADKEFTYHLLNDVIRMPMTVGYFDPGTHSKFNNYKTHHNLAQIVNSIEESFTYPLICKMNQGLRGQNVFLCHSQVDLRQALSKIFNKRSRAYDYVSLVQEYVEPRQEYKLIVFKGKILLAYEKNIAEAKFAGNLSPLHYDNAKAVPVVDLRLVEQFQTFIDPIFRRINLEFGGIDVIMDQSGRLNLIELNTNPGFSIFLEQNDMQLVIEIYEKLLTDLVKKYE